MFRVIGVAFLVAAVFAVAAQAKVTDPRVCSYYDGPTAKKDCARDAAKIVARRFLAKQAGLTYSLWQGPMTCTGAGTLLRWRCTFTSKLPIGTGDVLVVYRALSAGWTVRATIER